MRFFKVLGGNHQEGEKTYERGKIVKTDRDLVKMFGSNTFLETDSRGRPLTTAEEDAEVTDLDNDEETAPVKKTSKDAKKAAVAEESEGEKAENDDKQESEPVEKLASKLGEDVTALFGNKVAENAMGVIKKGKAFFVVDRDTPDVPMNKDKALTSVKQVEAFLADYID